MHPCELLCALCVSLWMHHKKNPSLQLATGRKVWVGMLTAGGDDTYVPTPHVIHMCVCRNGISFFTPCNKPTICFHTHILSGGDSSSSASCAAMCGRSLKLLLGIRCAVLICCWCWFRVQAAVEWLCELAAWSFAIKFNYILRLSTYSVQRTITTSNAPLQLYCTTPSCCGGHACSFGQV